MDIIVHFCSDYVPETGLTPALSGYQVSNKLKVIDGVTMEEIGGGFYKYDFFSIDTGEDYLFLVDGGISLENIDRYKIGNIPKKGGIGGNFYF